ncbi:MAG: PhoH family protein [Spirochaetes bacterium]|nr:PhoH family protein [Spirochaetota bacterium]
MEGRIGLTLENTDVLAEVCGVNDYNLRIIEKLLGGRVFTRGNELFYEPADADTDGKGFFAPLVEGIVDAIVDGLPPGPDLVAAVYYSMNPDARDGLACPDALKDQCIQIPGGFGKVFPRTSGQMLYLKGLDTHDVTFSVGPAGTGKTYLAVAWALREVLSRSRRKLLITRPVVEAGESLGFLPGDLAQKINPYLRPLYDAMEAVVPYEVVRRLEETRAIEIAPLAYMRGRSLNHCVVILDEAQNTTREQMKMFLTRLGEGSAAVITGDITQVDLPRKGESGLIHALSLLSGIDGILVSKLDASDVVRNPMVKKIIQAYESE